MLPVLSSIFPATQIYFEPLPSPVENSAESIEVSAECSCYIEVPDICLDDFSTLRQHPLFPTIQAQFLEDIGTLLSLADKFVGGRYEEDIKTFQQRILNLPNSIYRDLLPLYKDTRYQIHHMAKMMREHLAESAGTIQYDTTRNRLTCVLHQCLTYLSVCNAVIHSEFFSAWRELTADGSLSSQLYAIRKEQLGNYIGHFLRVVRAEELVTISVSHEIHWFHGLFNLAALQLGLETIDDSWAPTSFSEQVLERFLSGLPGAVNSQTVQEQLVQGWLEKLTAILDSHNIGNWRTDPVAVESLSAELLDQIKQEISEPLGSLLRERGANDIGLWSLAVANDSFDDSADEHYDFRRSAEFLCGLLVQGVLAIEPVPLCQLSTAREFLFTLGGLFFWIETPSSHDALPTKYIPEQTTAVDLSHLLKMNIISWPEETQRALLLQAIEQTKNAKTVLDSLCSSGLGEQLRCVSEPIILTIANALTQRMEKSSSFANDLLKAATEINFDKIPAWLFYTPLLDTIVQTRCECNQPVTESVEWLLAPSHLPLVAGFSDVVLTTLFTPEQYCRLFQIAMKRGMGGFVHRLLGTGHCDECLVAPHGRAVLVLLISRGDVEGVKYVLASGSVDINEFHPTERTTALHVAAKSPSLACLQLLLDSPDININPIDKNGCHPIHWAVGHGRTENLARLLDRPDIDARCTDNEGSNAIHTAVAGGHVQCLTVLLRRCHETNPSALDLEGKDPIRIAAHKGHVECLKVLLAHPDVILNQISPLGLNIWHLATASGRTDALELLLSLPNVPVNIRSFRGYAMLHIATTSGNIEALRLLLLKQELDVNLPTIDDGSTALQIAVSRGYTEFVRLLLRDERTTVSRSFLRIAERHGFREIAALLAQDRRLPTSIVSFRMPSFFFDRP